MSNKAPLITNIRKPVGVFLNLPTKYLKDNTEIDDAVILSLLSKKRFSMKFLISEKDLTSKIDFRI